MGRGWGYVGMEKGLDGDADAESSQGEDDEYKVCDEKLNSIHRLL